MFTRNYYNLLYCIGWLGTNWNQFGGEIPSTSNPTPHELYVQGCAVIDTSNKYVWPGGSISKGSYGSGGSCSSPSLLNLSYGGGQVLYNARDIYVASEYSYIYDSVYCRSIQLLFGDGDTPVSEDDYCLSGDIIYVAQRKVNTTLSLIGSGVNRTIIEHMAVESFCYNAKTIKEFILTVPIVRKYDAQSKISNTTCCIYRHVFDTPISVQARQNFKLEFDITLPAISTLLPSAVNVSNN